MNILIYDLELKQIALLNPGVQLLTCQDRESLEKRLLVTQPDYLILSEAEAEEILKWNNTLSEDDMSVIVVASGNNPQEVREWTKIGAHYVWAREEWEKQLDEFISAHLLQHTPSRLHDDAIAVRSLDDWSDDDTLVIAVGGVYSGVGSTHTALLIANFLSRYTKQPVALWESTQRPTFEFLQYIKHGKNNDSPKFKIGSVTYFKSEVDATLIEDAADQFRYLVIDMGCIQECTQKELFFKSRLSVLVGSASEWRVQENIRFCGSYSQSKQNRWRIVLPLASPEAQEETAQMLSGRPVFSLPGHFNVFDQQDDTDQVLEGVLSPILPKKAKRKFSQLFFNQ
ncbi:hypothetical protein FHR92_002991 [Fontibacillus solani]|uniref:Uncharacterized protein n=1 Tax=Fontibacillus solani TaxID=1572857 RepID=A0A7W3SV33_9BACL|nr:hypothetical protein [Fontibacillus solani]MBA9086513.1 hypothetical protein [Fontibacillus solani]